MPLSDEQRRALKNRAHQGPTTLDEIAKDAVQNYEEQFEPEQAVSRETVTEQDKQYPPDEEIRAYVRGQREIEHIVDIPPEDARAIAEYEPAPLVRGLVIPEQATQEQKERIVEMIFSYIGVTPRAIDAYCGRWLKCIGAVVAPLSGEVEVLDEYTNEVKLQTIQWDSPMFKLDSIDDITGLNVVIAGGGASGKKFAHAMTQLFGPGDWKTPMLIFISQEARQGVNKRTGELEPRRLYRFAHRRMLPQKGHPEK